MRTQNLLLSNHALVLAVVAHDPRAEIAEISEATHLRGRTVHRVLNDLEAAGYLSRSKVGWRRRYEVHREARLCGPAPISSTVGALLDAVT